MAAKDSTTLARLSVEIETKATDHVEPDKQSRAQVDLLFDAITKPGPEYPLDSCPHRSQEFVDDMRHMYDEPLKEERDETLQTIAENCRGFVKRGGMVETPSG